MVETPVEEFEAAAEETVAEMEEMPPLVEEWASEEYEPAAVEMVAEVEEAEPVAEYEPESWATEVEDAPMPVEEYEPEIEEVAEEMAPTAEPAYEPAVEEYEPAAEMVVAQVVEEPVVEEIYEAPNNLFVASFVGDMCFLSGEVVEPGTVRLAGGEVVHAKTSSGAGTSVTLTVRPEKLHLYPDEASVPPGRNIIHGTVARRTFYGDSLAYEVSIGASGSFDVRVENIPSMTRWAVGDEVVIDFHPEAAMALAE